jgi:4-amino-4-deoxy-L-arabinose transferase-like glycosyltransferase
MSSVAARRPPTGGKEASAGRRSRGRRLSLPREAWLCALVACLNAVCWSFITPPFQVPDEPDHYAYVEQLALTGSPPSSSVSGRYASDLALTEEGLRTDHVRLQPEDPAVYSAIEKAELERDIALTKAAPVRATGAAGVATDEPPLYYVLELIPYELGSGGSVLDRLELMRLMSAAMAGLTALFTFLFVREVLPRTRWAWTVGGAAVAVTPMLGFMSGGVTPEALLYAVSAAMFYVLARAFRRGLTRRGAASIAVVAAVGLLTKLNFVGFVPGIALGVVALILRMPGTQRRRVYQTAGGALAVVAALVAVAAAVGAVGHSAFHSPEATVLSITRPGSLLGRINYIWQFYLPRIPGTPNDFPGIFTPRQIWFNGLVGLYGWLDTTFPEWVYDAALVPAGCLALLFLGALLTERSSLGRRLAEIATYALLAAGLLILVGASSYTGFPRYGAAYAESRYLLPLLALMGAALALAVRSAGRRWGPVLGVVVLMLFAAHDLFSQLQVIARYYG